MRTRCGILFVLTLALLTSSLGCQGQLGLSASGQHQVAALLRIRRSDVDRDIGSPDDQVYRETQGALLRSPFVLLSALRDNEIRELSIVKQHARPVEWLEGKLQVAMIPDSELVRVSLPVPELASKAEISQWEQLLGAVVNAYLAEVVNKERLEQIDTLNKMRNRYRQMMDDLKKTSDEVAGLKAQLGFVNAVETDRRLRQLDRLDATRLDLELQAIGVGVVGSDTEKEVTELQLKHVQNLQEKELDLGKASGEVEVREEEIRHLREDARAIREEIRRLESRVESRDPVQLIHSPTWISP